jgi:DsbC/DsbD-like thiol-disulfide interchange protein
MHIMLRSILLFVLLLAAALVSRAGGPVSWTFEPSVHADGRVQVLLKVTCEEGWHIYAMALPREDGPIPTSIQLTSSASYSVGPVSEPTPETAYDANFAMELRFHSGVAVFSVPLQRLNNGPLTVTGEVEYMACNDKTCLPPKVVPFSVTVPAL